MPPSGQSYEPIRPKIELGRDFVPIYAYMKYEIDQRNIQGARALTSQKFTDGRTDRQMDGISPLCSTGHRPLLGPLPCLHLALAPQLMAGQGYR